MSSKLSFSREGMSSRNNFYPKSHTLSNLLIMTSVENFVCGQLCQRATCRWILRARDRDRDILARLRFGHQRPLNRRCPHWLGHQRPVNRGCPRVSKPVSQDIQSICYCLHTGIFRLDTCDLVVAGVRISISPKYLYLYLALKILTHVDVEDILFAAIAIQQYE